MPTKKKKKDSPNRTEQFNLSVEMVLNFVYFLRFMMFFFFNLKIFISNAGFISIPMGV